MKRSVPVAIVCLWVFALPLLSPAHGADRMSGRPAGEPLALLLGGDKGEQPDVLQVDAPMNLTVAPVSESQIDVSWEAVSGAVTYHVYRDGSFLAETTYTSLPDSGIKADTRYCYAVTAVDRLGKESGQSVTECAATLRPAGPDLKAPAVKAQALSESQITVTWKELREASAYKVYRENAYLTTVTTPTLADSGLRAGSQYCYAVSTVDVLGNEGPQSRTVCATTLGGAEGAARAAEAASGMSAGAEAVKKAMQEKGRATIDIEFDTNKAVVKHRYHVELQKFAEVLNAHPELTVVIEGHTDNVGGKAYNQKLSQRRAEAVRAYLVKTFKVSSSQLAAKGFGMERPLADNVTKEGRQKNRRVEAAATFTLRK